MRCENVVALSCECIISFFLYRSFRERMRAESVCIQTKLSLLYTCRSAVKEGAFLRAQHVFGRIKIEQKGRLVPKIEILHSKTPIPFALKFHPLTSPTTFNFQLPAVLIPALSINPLNVVCRLLSSSCSRPLLLPTTDKPPCCCACCEAGGENDGTPSARSANRACEAGTRVGVLS